MQGIKYLDYYVPEERIGMDAFLELLAEDSIPGSFRDKGEYRDFLSDVLQLSGVNYESRLTPQQMLDGLLEKMLDNKEIEPEMVDLVLFTARESDNMSYPGIGQYLLRQHGFTKAYCLQLYGNNCSNVEFAMDMAFQLLRAYKFRNILVVAVSMTRRMEERVMGSYAVLGDAAGIVLLSKDNALLSQKSSDIQINATLHDVAIEKDNSLQLFKYYVSSLENIQKKAGLGPEEIGRIIVQNANPLLVMPCLEAAGLDTGNLFRENFGRFGHLDCVDIIVNLKDALNDPISKNKCLLTFGTGIRGSYISMILKYC